MRSLASIAIAAIFIVGCGGGATSNGIPASSQTSPQKRAARVTHRVSAHVAFGTESAPVRGAAPRREAHYKPIAEEALQAGVAYPRRESWGYSNLDPSCGSLEWTYDNTIPGVTVTLNPTSTGLDGRTEVSFSKIPPDTPVGVYQQTVTGTCTGDDPSGTLPVPTDYTIAVVTLDVGRIAQIPAAPTIESDKTFEPVVGQFMELKAVAGPDVPLRVTTWSTIPGDVIASYTETQMLASPKPFDPSDLSKQTIDFYWIKDSGAPLDLKVYAVFPVKAVHCNQTCTGEEEHWGAANAQSKANVVAPTGVSMTSKTGQVWVGADPALDCNVALHFGFFDTASCPGVTPGAKGIAWTFKATAPVGGAGDLDATQLIDRDDSRTPLGGGPNPPPPEGTNGKTLLDECTQYGNEENAHASVGASSSATWTSSDSPDDQLADGWKTFTDADTFAMYFVYRAANEGGLSPASSRANIWIPIGSLHWNWQGTATNSGTFANPKWKLSASSYAHNPSGAGGITALPTWTGLFNAAPTKCPAG